MSSEYYVRTRTNWGEIDEDVQDVKRSLSASDLRLERIQQGVQDVKRSLSASDLRLERIQQGVQDASLELERIRAELEELDKRSDATDQKAKKALDNIDRCLANLKKDLKTDLEEYPTPEQ